MYFVNFTVFSVYLAGMKKTGNYCMCSFGVLITNIMRKDYQSTEQTVLSHCTSRTVQGFSHTLMINVWLFSSTYIDVTIKLLPHCHTLYPRSHADLSRFYLSFVFTIIHESGLPLLCILACECKWKAKTREAWEQG